MKWVQLDLFTLYKTGIIDLERMPVGHTLFKPGYLSPLCTLPNILKDCNQITNVKLLVSKSCFCMFKFYAMLPLLKDFSLLCLYFLNFALCCAKIIILLFSTFPFSTFSDQLNFCLKICQCVLSPTPWPAENTPQFYLFNHEKKILSFL